MIERYTLLPMAELWSDRSRFEHMLKVELAVSRALADAGEIPAEAVDAMEAGARVDIDRLNELERTTDHDVVAFVTQVAETVGEGGRWLHYGLTSSDVVDTGLALQCRAAAELILGSLDALIAAIVALPGATTLLQYMLEKLRGMVERLVVRPERMAENIERGLGLHASSRLLTALIDGGLSRSDAYAVVQRNAMRALDERVQFRELVAADPEVSGTLDRDAIDRCFDDRAALAHVPEVIARLERLDP